MFGYVVDSGLHWGLEELAWVRFLGTDVHIPPMITPWGTPTPEMIIPTGLIGRAAKFMDEEWGGSMDAWADWHDKMADYYLKKCEDIGK